MTTKTERAVEAITRLSRRAEVIITLDTFTARDLKVVQPQDSETLVGNIGVGTSNLDRFVRPWVNKRFREPDGNSRLPPGALTASTTFSQLCDYAGA